MSFEQCECWAHYIFVRGKVAASDPITLKSRSNPALFLSSEPAQPPDFKL